MSNSITAEQTSAIKMTKWAAKPEKAARPDKPVIVMKRIGSTTYHVAVHFSQTSTETINDKILRLIKNEAACQ